MTITTTSIVAGPYPATGAEQTLNFSFKAFTASEIEVVTGVGSSAVAVDPDLYTVNRNMALDGQVLEGGTVVLSAGAVSAGVGVRLIAKPKLTQEQVWSDTSSRLKNLNEGLDRAALRAQRAAYDGALEGAGSELIAAAEEAGEAAGAAAGAAAASGKQDDQTLLPFAYAQPLTDKDRWLRRPVNLFEFSHLVTDTDDWTAAANAMYAAKRECYVPDLRVGNFRITDMVSMHADGNMTWGGGGGKGGGRFYVNETFNMAAKAVVYIPPTAAENHAGFQNFGIEFYQPNTGRAGFIRYPWAIWMVDVSRTVIDNLRISGAWDGINAAGNTGGMIWGTIENGSANMGFQWGAVPVQKFACNNAQKVFTLDRPEPDNTKLTVAIENDNGTFSRLAVGSAYTWTGPGQVTLSGAAPNATKKLVISYGPSLDFPHLNTYASWPHGFGLPAQLAGYWDGNTIAARIGRVDGVDIKSFTSFAGKLEFVQNPDDGEGAFGEITALLLDSTYARLDITAGRMTIGGGYLSASGTDAETYAIRCRLFGVLTCGPFTIAGPPNGTVPFIQNSSRLNMGRNIIHNVSLNAPLVQSTAGTIRFEDNIWLTGTEQVRTVAALQCTGGVSHFNDNHFAYAGSAGGGPQIEIVTDDVHTCTGNMLAGWGYITPATGGLGIYGPNIGVSELYGTAAASTVILRPGKINYLLTAGSAVSDFSGGVNGRIYTVCFQDPGTINESANIRLAEGSTWAFKAGDTFSFLKINGIAYEVSRTYNRNTRFRDQVAADPVSLSVSDHRSTVFLTNCAAVPGNTLGSWVISPKGTTIQVVVDAAVTVPGNAATIYLKGGTTRSIPANGVLLLVSNGTKYLEVAS